MRRIVICGLIQLAKRMRRIVICGLIQLAKRMRRIVIYGLIQLAMRMRRIVICGLIQLAKRMRRIVIYGLIQLAMRMRRIVICGMPGCTTFFPTLSRKLQDFRKTVIRPKTCVLIFSTTFARNISHCKNNSTSYRKCPQVFM